MKSEILRHCKQMETETCAAEFGIRVQISLQPTDSGRPSHVVPDVIFLKIPFSVEFTGYFQLRR